MGPQSSQRRRALTTVLVVRLGSERYALPIEAVEEIWPALLIDPVPQCPPDVRGVVFVRGELAPVIDAARRLGVRGHERPEEPPIVSLRVGSRLVGVEFDEVIDLMELRPEPALSPDGLGVQEGVICGLVEQDGHILRVLDPERLAAPPAVRGAEASAATA